MLEDTGFLFGSVTKILTTTLVLQQVERGAIDLDEGVTTYLPEFKLVTPDAAHEIRVRNLLTHTNGIDADLFCPDVNGPGALKVLLEGLGQHCGVLFRPGEYVSYSNGGMLMAGRLLEVVTGMSYHHLLERELYHRSVCKTRARLPKRPSSAAPRLATFQMRPATVSNEPTCSSCRTPGHRPAAHQSVPSVICWSSHGPIWQTVYRQRESCSVVRVNREHAMRIARHGNTEQPAHRARLVALMPFGNTTVLSMSGASPGGVAVLAVVPEQDLAFAAFGNDPRAIALHDQLVLWLLRVHLRVDVPDLVSHTEPVSDLNRYAGRYRSNQMRVDVSVVDGQLEEQLTYEPVDEEQAHLFTKFAGGWFSAPPGALSPFARTSPRRPGCRSRHSPAIRASFSSRTTA